MQRQIVSISVHTTHKCNVKKEKEEEASEAFPNKVVIKVTIIHKMFISCGFREPLIMSICR